MCFWKQHLLLSAIENVMPMYKLYDELISQGAEVGPFHPKYFELFKARLGILKVHIGKAR